MKYIYLVLLCFLVYSCSEEQIPEPVASEPVFSARGLNSSNPFAIEAGVSNYYMYSDYEQDPNGVYSFIGDLRGPDASNLPGLRIEIRADKETGQGGIIDVFESLKSGLYQYREPNVSDEFAALQMDPMQSGASLSYNWDFGDGNSSQLESPTHRYREPGFYRVTLNVTNQTTSCQSSVSNVIDYFKYDLNSLNLCTADFSMQQTGGNTMNYSSANANADMYYWDFGDGSTGFGKLVDHTYSQPGKYIVQHVTYRMADSCSKEQAMEVHVGSPGSCSANFNIRRVTNASPDSLELSRVTVKWTDPTNGLFSTDKIIQQIEDTFEIISVENYKVNEKGDATVKVLCRFSCELANEESAQSIRLDNVECSFAFAFPN